MSRALFCFEDGYSVSLILGLLHIDSMNRGACFVIFGIRLVDFD